MPEMVKHEKLRGGTEYNAVNKKSAQRGRDLVADVADNMCATHCVHDDKQGADSDDAAVGKAAKKGGGCENVTLGENNSEKQKNWEESPNCDAGDDNCGAKGELPSQRVV